MLGRGVIYAYLRLRPPLQLRLNGPWKQRLPVFLQNRIRDHGVSVFGVNEESVHVEQTCAHAGETEEGLVRYKSMSSMAHGCSVCELSGAYLLDEAIVLLCTQVKHTTLVVERMDVVLFVCD